METLKPKDVALGNFISCFGKTEMVAGLVPQENNTWIILHKAWNQKNNPIPEGVQFDPLPILLNQDWKICLKIDKVEFPERIKYVHQAQNYMKWHFDIDLLEILDWDLLPTNNEIEE